jgi:hypothetical protein
MEFVIPDWPAPANVRAAMTTRALDLAPGQNDDRRRLREALALPAEPGWLRQVHGTNVARLSPPPRPSTTLGTGLRGEGGSEGPEADASYATEPGAVCVAMAADCLPVLFCDDRGSVVAVAHAGWRGLAAGVLEAAVRAMAVHPGSLMAWMGAAIGPASFEVGAEVREAFVARDAAAAACFRPAPPRHSREGGNPVPVKYFADLYALARLRLAAAGVGRVYGGGFDTYPDARRFFSYRRDGSRGRMAALVWLTRQTPQEIRANE